MLKKWTCEPQPTKGRYDFSGTLCVSNRVDADLDQDEIAVIYLTIKMFVEQNDGTAGLFFFTNEEGKKLVVLDLLSREMIASKIFPPNHNRCFMFWEHEM